MHLQLEILKEGYIYILRKALISYCNQLLWKTGAYDKDSPSWPNSCRAPGSAPSSRSVCAMCSIAQSCPTLATSWTVAHQASLSMGFPKQECWSGLPFPSLGNLGSTGIEPRSPALQACSLPTEPLGKPQFYFIHSSVYTLIWITQSSHPRFPTLFQYLYVYSLHLCLYLSFANKFMKYLVI